MYRRPKIPTEVKNLIFLLYDKQCTICGESEPRKLQIHHIDKDPSNNSIENLMLLCYEHHAIVYHPEKAGEMIQWWIEKFGL